ncbi:hypothetical protein COY28_00925 [Candidatus Woesearchaeota archaeon CG_4_10_14_0_2_um_filter_57_5]|nr:MAG: hypothetical protein AUJ68_00590 [Candidatus Woesearchaeota archaeon CG1_02_57_44]PIZ56483.1 MAG: hypothetical protein COY28_00925 [Candidatus Woesearchaeota archaeon CG_4_10_14_0_2_um_filter_57_5]
MNLRAVSNNVVLMLILALVLVSVGLNMLVVRMTQQRLQGLVTQGEVRFCLGGRSTIAITSQQNFDRLHGVIDINATAAMDRESLRYTEIYLTYSPPWVGDNYSLIGNFTNDGSDQVTLSYNMSGKPDGSCYYALKAVGHSPCIQFHQDVRSLTVDEEVEPPDTSLFTNVSATSNWTARGHYRDITNLTIDTTYGLMHFLENITTDGLNISRYLIMHDKYVQINSSWLSCLDRKATLVFYNVSFIYPVVYRDGQLCDAPQCVRNPYTNGTFSVNVSSFSTYTVQEGHYPTLVVFDDTDGTTGNQSRYILQPIWMYGNLTYADDGLPVNTTGVTCWTDIRLPTGIDRRGMNYNTTSRVYLVNSSFTSPGTYNYTVFCNATDAGYDMVNQSGRLNVANRAPVLVELLPDLMWNWNTPLTGLDLNDYFTDPDGEVLEFFGSSATNMTVDIEGGVVTITPKRNFIGDNFLVFWAFDPSNASAQSNIIKLTVVRLYGVPEEDPPTASSVVTTAVTTRSSSITLLWCVPDWTCGDWGSCAPAGLQARLCRDLHDCGVDDNKPVEVQQCEYVAACDDHLKNGDETGVDCGGSCAPCPTCDDGVQNQGEFGLDCGGPCASTCPTCFDKLMDGDETGVDCGGSCGPCATCGDGMQNQGESGIDCGGPCDACEVLPGPHRPGFWAYGALLLVLLLTAGYRVLKPFRKSLDPMRAQDTPPDIITIALARAWKLFRSKNTAPATWIQECIQFLHAYCGRVYGIEEELAIDELFHRVKATLPKGTKAKFERLVRQAEAQYTRKGIGSAAAKAMADDAIAIVLALHTARAIPLLRREARAQSASYSSFQQWLLGRQMMAGLKVMRQARDMVEQGDTTEALRLLAQVQEMYAHLPAAMHFATDIELLRVTCMRDMLRGGRS